MRNEHVPNVANTLRDRTDWQVFDDWHCVGPEADDYWQQYERDRGRHYREALYGPHATNVFNFDKAWLEKADAVCLIAPAGKSAHLELGWSAGQGKRTYVLFDEEPPRFDIMYQFCTNIFFDVEELIKELSKDGGQ